MDNVNTVGRDPTRELERSSISWRAIFAGLFVSLLTYMILMAFGIAVGSAGLASNISGGLEGSTLSIGSGIWVVLSALVSLFAGCYYAARAAGLIATRVGAIQGLVVASLFFLTMFSQIGAAIGFIGGGLGSAVGSIGKGASEIAKAPEVQDTIQSSLGELNLKSPPDQVVQGIATRLIQGNTIGARNYLAAQAGISPAEAQTRIDTIANDVQSTARDIGQKTAKAVSMIGWTVFGYLLLGSLAALFGGMTGAKFAVKHSVEYRPRHKTAA
ncbi:MAG TPA: hypothetical protein DCS07_09475 [Bdellovibrionales bacterium]|nr:MAG: hypothetical protein A2X97_03255 [Bdellovibrionales bacterium GWA1_52_35]OFZ40649.1 MAG: hypothetical protein A2070_06265 [Bdellovibrionales bacterium GWC1_52_8]HAR42841.1 hypothetical protein [Bdellovibrionales bacterium]HCM40367.1 hypothetical protein [Bdellovibrionales bacterium]